MFGVLIKSCYVTDGFGKKADVIDDQGLALASVDSKGGIDCGKGLD